MTSKYINSSKNSNNSSSCIPFVEKYRPKRFDDIVLDEYNKKILKNIIVKSYFPNLLFFGPPGTGKTTTIINLINSYQEKLNCKNKDLVIHLNASDERGIDVIRNQINCFVNTKPLFNDGMKFVILDEVDYMTKNAQQALRYLLENYYSSVRFCLICNYISKIDEGLQNEFIKLRFNQLPKHDIFCFLNYISESEKLNLSKEKIEGIQKIYGSDIRSMINYMQSNQEILSKQNDTNNKYDDEIFELNIINNDIWDSLISKFKNKDNYELIIDYISLISDKFNIDKKNIIKDLLNYIIRNNILLNVKFLSFIENILHTQEWNGIYINYFVIKMLTFL